MHHVSSKSRVLRGSRGSQDCEQGWRGGTRLLVRRQRPEVRFHPFSRRFYATSAAALTVCRKVISIPSPSGLLQNALWRKNSLSTYCFNPFSFRSPSKPSPGRKNRAPRPFQSLLLQVSFKTPSDATLCPGDRFNPFSFRSPSKRTWPAIAWRRCRFNPFSFRSPSKPGGKQNEDKHSFQSLLLQVSFKTANRMRIHIPGVVSIPSPSGLLQNEESSK